jgi:hypothetical protein
MAKIAIILQGLVWSLMGWSIATAQVQDGPVTAPPSDRLVSQGGTSGLDAVHAVVEGVSGNSAQALVNQIQIGNVMEEGLAASLAVVRESFQNNRGIIGANQNTWKLNNQANVQVIAHVSDGSTIQLGQATIEQRLVDNTIVTSGAARHDLIENSFGGTVGIVGITQKSGTKTTLLNP